MLDLRKTDGPLYRRVYHALKVSIREGRLAPDARLPSTRELAADLRVSRNTVLLAYEQLLAEGYVVSRNRATASVASTLPMSGVPARSKPGHLPPVSAYARRLTTLLGTPSARSGLRYDFRYGEPSVDEFPREIWRRLLATRMRRPARDGLGYADPAGHMPLREALAEYLKRARGVVCEADQIVIAAGGRPMVPAPVLESGLPFGGAPLGGRIWRLETDARRTLLVENLRPPVNGLTLHDGHLFVSEGGHPARISRFDRDGRSDPRLNRATPIRLRSRSTRTTLT